jgi:hypothetical protein
MSTQETRAATLGGLSPSQATEALRDLVDVLIPGDETWPSASAIGVQGLIAVRLFEDAGDDCLHQVLAALLDAGGPLVDHNEADRIAIVSRFSTSKPELFERVRAAAVLAYYEHPFVVEVIRTLGRPYLLRPHLTGYPMKAFDMDKDRPRHERGSYLETDAVKRLEVSGLQLDQIRTKRWGLDR